MRNERVTEGMLTSLGIAWFVWWTALLAAVTFQSQWAWFLVKWSPLVLIPWVLIKGLRHRGR
jgi:hypothetical protein